MADAYPAPAWKWFSSDGREINIFDVKYDIITLQTSMRLSMSTLRIFGAEAAYNANVVLCEATNSLGKASARVEYLVHGKQLIAGP